MTDRLAALLDRYAVAAEVFHAGALCGINTVQADAGLGQLHLVRRGAVEVIHAGPPLRIDAPSLLLYPRPMAHRFVTDAVRGADMACANLRFEDGDANPVAAGLPAFVCMRLDEVAGLSDVLGVLFDEAFARRCGRAALLNRLFEVAMIQILRELMERGAVQVGLLGGLAHPRLRHALVAMHEAPARPWTLEALAETAGMSRSSFAAGFRAAVGVTPGQYLQGWRVGLARQALRRGQPLKVVATAVGYGSEAALSRAFKASSGLSPREWKRRHPGGAAA
ncbi:cupin domain-containing protein [Luteimonas huabeiensis]|uniref:cupin domain-containing protein n=1 Tax=Luteimonas huabeiensis TaxID=1244513 RepID=UPI000465BBAA|nr:cupin domain-containing protein [Luteimonas huabeiensis]